MGSVGWKTAVLGESVDPYAIRPDHFGRECASVDAVVAAQLREKATLSDARVAGEKDDLVAGRECLIELLATPDQRFVGVANSFGWSRAACTHANCPPRIFATLPR